MFKIVVGLMVFGAFALANTSLLYTVSKGEKDLGFYEINYNDSKNNIKTKAYGTTNKVKFFVDKKIEYVNDGYRNIAYSKNKQVTKFDIYTKKSLLPEKLIKKYDRKIRKVKNDDMLLITKNGKRNIELFNKRKINLLTLEEILKLSFTKIESKNIILFEKTGVMKMIAKIVPTSTGFDIINKSKDTKYIQVIVKNNIPVTVKSYISDWSMNIYGAGKFQLKKVNIKDIKNKALKILEAKLSKSDSVEFLGLNTMRVKSKSYLLSYNAKVAYPENLAQKDQKRYCVKQYKRFSNKGKNIKYNENSCSVTLTQKLVKQDINQPIIDELKENYPQLKQTKKFKISKKGTIMYKIIDKVQ